ncbi:MAG TPA: alginate export family protein [Chryseolinea sp.]|nr:alginate export family protein [Chryseolinea sp.]
MKKIYTALLVLCLCIFTVLLANAQLSISGQMRTRTELRDGQGAPSVKDTVPAFFTSQRTRLNVGYAGYRFKVYASLQDVRVWGQDASSINRTTGDAFDGFMVHEAWGEISLVDTGKVIKNFTLKVGRQELVYDDVRLLGNLDWLQQARRHDAALIKFDHKGWTAHAGFAYNQNAERKSNVIYNGVPAAYAAGTNGIGALYKSMQFLYAARKLKVGTVSFLFFKDDFSKFHFAANDVEKKTPIYDKSAWSRYTVGSHFLGNVLQKVAVTADAFYQTGHYREGTVLNEYLLSLSALYSVNAKFSLGPGVDITSGNNGSDPSRKYQRFDPLYGTPHKFWGSMDYFYVADGFGANGLIDAYLKTRYKVGNNLTMSLDAHQFVLPNSVTSESGELLSKQLGTEIDLTTNWMLTKIITIEGGYSLMASTSTLTSMHVKNIKNADRFSQWAYLMISIKPESVISKK